MTMMFGGRAVHGFDAVTMGLSSDDCNGHGTHVSGTIGGGTYGIAKGAVGAVDKFQQGDYLGGFLDALGVPPARIPADLDGQAGLYRSLLAGRRVLVVLDNARDADQVRPLLPGSPTALAVVTSRNQLTSLVATDGARPLPLDLLSTVEARELLANRLGADRVAAGLDAVDRIIDRCARLPLALAVAAARAATQPNLSLAAPRRSARRHPT